MCWRLSRLADAKPTPPEAVQRCRACVSWRAIVGPKTMTSGWTDFRGAGRPVSQPTARTGQDERAPTPENHSVTGGDGWRVSLNDPAGPIGAGCVTMSHKTRCRTSSATSSMLFTIRCREASSVGTRLVRHGTLL